LALHSRPGTFRENLNRTAVGCDLRSAGAFRENLNRTAVG